MKLNGSQTSLALGVGALALATTGCEAVQGIFKAGVWVGVAIVLVIIALIVWAIKAVLS
jgi:hypothetical protein